MWSPPFCEFPENEPEREELREVIRDNNLVYKVMVSDDFKATAMVLTLEKDAVEDDVFADIHSILEANPGDEKIYFRRSPLPAPGH